uniref:Uncharacterized protein n=1 Tax=Magallana gigas TaxID=29159 RepID=A0A8W8I2M1_MAGGI
MTTVDVENLLEETASLQVPNTVTMEHTENTGIVAPESITEVPPFEDILPDLLGVGESGEIDKPPNHYHRPRVVVRPHRPVPPGVGIFKGKKNEKDPEPYSQEKKAGRGSHHRPSKKMKSVIKKST